jgi:hypothetical protein
MDGESKRFSYIDALWQSFFSRALYADVAQRWRGLGFLYLLFIVVLGWVPSLVKMQVAMEHARSGSSEALIRQVPAITITDGTASADVETPYFIKDPSDGKILAIIDFTGQYTSLEGTSAALLLTRHNLVTKQSGQEIRSYDLSGVKHFSLDQAHVRRWWSLLLTWLVVLITPFAIGFAYAFRICQALVYAAVGMAFASRYRVPLNYSALLRIACVAVTPVIAVIALTDLLPLPPSFPHSLLWLMHIVIAIWYIAFGVKACAAEPVEFVPPPSPPAPVG